MSDGINFKKTHKIIEQYREEIENNRRASSKQRRATRKSSIRTVKRRQRTRNKSTGNNPSRRAPTNARNRSISPSMISSSSDYKIGHQPLTNKQYLQTRKRIQDGVPLARFGNETKFATDSRTIQTEFGTAEEIVTTILLDLRS